MKVYNNIIDLIGNTPLLELKKYKKENNLKGNIIAKLESFNPAGSAKDRVAYYMIKDAIEKGILKKGATIIEPTSGNTGIGLAMISLSMGFKTILTMPDTMSVERRQLLKAYGAEIVLTEGSLGMDGAIKKALELKNEIPNSFIPSQFENKANSKAHFETTGPEIWQDMEGKIDYFIAGIGTGGTITGVGEYLKSKNSNIKIIGLEPDTSPVLSKGIKGPHQIQGIGAGFVPKILNCKIIDEIMVINIEEAYDTGKRIVKSEGLLVGISSAAALFAATLIAQKEENENKNIVVLLPDNGEKYLSTPMFN